MAINKKDLKEFILKEVKSATEAGKPRLKLLDEWQKRFEALRSTASLDDDIKKTPWYGASNIGIPIEATVVYTIVARLMRGTFGVTPEIGVHPNDLKFSETLQSYINWQLWTEMNMFMPLMLIYQGMMVDGDKIIKTAVEKDEIYFDDEEIIYTDKKGDPYISEETGNEVEAEDEDQPAIYKADASTGEIIEYKPHKMEKLKNRVTYYGPKAINCPTKHIIVPQDADDIDPSKNDWICHEFWKPWGWIYMKAKNNPELFDRKAVDALKKEKDKERAIEEDSKLKVLGIDLKTKTKRFRFLEWHGKFEDEDGNTHELIALLAPDQKQMMGFVSNRFYFVTGRRQFVHYPAFPQDGKFWSKGAPEWLRGIRSMIDASINTGFDRASIEDNPPTLFDIKNSGFDPDIHKTGPGKTWGLRKITPDAIRKMERGQTAQETMMREEMLFEIIQKLFGITDYALGSQGKRGGGVGGAQGTHTASGIASLLNEGNMRFDVIIRQVQQWSNPELAYQVFKHFTMNRFSIMEEKKLHKPKSVFEPLMQMTEDELNSDFEYVFKGNTQTINPQIEQQQVENLYMLFTKTQNPFVMEDPDCVHDMTEALINSSQVKAFRIKSVDDFRKMHATEPKKASEMVKKAKQEDGQQQPEEAIAGGNGRLQ